MTTVPDNALLEWASGFTGIPRADIENGVALLGVPSPGATAPGNGSAAGKRPPSGGPPKSHGHSKPVSVQGESLNGDMRAFEERFRRVTGQITHTVEINALLLGAGIESACIDFRDYTADKIEKMRHAEEMEKLAMEILEVCATAVSSGFAAVRIEGEIAQEVFKALAETTIKVVKAKAEPNTSAGFTKFVESLISGAKQSGHDAGSAAIEIVRREIKAAEKAFDKAKTDGVSLSGSKEYGFVEHFLFEDSSRFDYLVARHVGIPTPEMVNKVQIKMTGDMIHRFAEKFLRATRDPIATVINDTAGEDSFRVANDAMGKLKKKHGFHYDD